MTLAELQAEIETERAWREAELRGLHNILSTLPTQDEQDRFRRAIVVMLYAHFEGYTKFLLLLYVKVVNQRNLSSRNLNWSLAASALHDVFSALRNPEKKCDVFRNRLPDDRKLHRLAREIEFLEVFEEAFDQVATIPDAAVDLENNIKPVVLEKALFMLGLPRDHVKSYADTINRLLAFRNGIAHGSHKAGISRKDYQTLNTVVFRLMSDLQQDIAKAVRDEKYVRAS